MRLKWHRDQGLSAWFAEIDGERIAEAVNTSATGTDDYPWDWGLTDAGVARAKPGRHQGVADTLRSVKEHVAALVA